MKSDIYDECAFMAEDIIVKEINESYSFINSLNPGIYYVVKYKNQYKHISSRYNDAKPISINCSLFIDENRLSATNNFRVVKHKTMLFRNELQFNHYLLGYELSKAVEWQLFLSIKIKYLFSKELSIQLNNMLFKIKKKLQKRLRIYFSSDEYFFISFMKSLCSFDAQVSHLMVSEFSEVATPSILSLLLQCFGELSANVVVLFL